ncbi:MAG: CehA/McbA family metallohydrolase [bacterium]
MMSPTRLWILGLCSLLCLLPAVCPGQEYQAPRNRQDLHNSLLDDLNAVRHPSDGGGRAWLVDERSTMPAVCSSAGRWIIIYQAGPHGISPEGAIFLQISPFWGWTTPQPDFPDRPGYTWAVTSAEGAELELETVGQQLLAIWIGGRGLVEGERVRIVYGGTESGRSLADRFAEHDSPFWIAVDGDGDGIRRVLPGSPTVDVVAGHPAQLLVTVPTTARPGDSVSMNVAVLDRMGNAGFPFEGEISFSEPTAGLELPAKIEFEAKDGGRQRVVVTVRSEGIFRVTATGPNGLSCVSNPLVALAAGPRVLWGDLHGHSNLSDGSGTPDDYYRYARDVAGLDVAALTDHDHWGMLFLDIYPDIWAGIQEVVARYHEPGRFVSLLGYEWTSWLHGHRHVVYFQATGELYSSLHPDYDTPPKLWDALSGQQVLTFAHHSAGDPVPVNWSYAPDPVLEPLTEIVSVHGSSESLDSPSVVRGAIPGNTVRDQLGRYRLGLVGSGDSHDGHPGLAHLASGPGLGGITAIIAEEVTREAVYEALRNRRCYATNGPRILLRCSLAGHRMGSTVPATASAEVRGFIVATAPIRSVDIIRSGQVISQTPEDEQTSCFLNSTLADLRAGEYVYLRVIQDDGGAAWSSPFFVE